MTKIPKDGFLETSISLENNTLKLKGECAGKVIKTIYNGKEFEIHFPNFTQIIDTDQRKRKPTLQGTEFILDHLRNHLEEFGSIYTYLPRDDQEFSFQCKRLIIKSSKPLSSKGALELLGLLQKWKDEFISWLEIVEFRPFNDDYSLGKVTNQQIGYLVKKDSSFEFLVSGNTHLFIKPDLYNGTDIKSISKALTLMLENEYIPKYYAYLIDALKHFRRDDFRHCVLDLATAYELCLISLKDSYYHNHQLTDIIKKTIDEKYYQIKQLSDLNKRFYEGDNAITDRLSLGIKIVAEIRNKAIHEGQEVKPEDAQKALEFVKEFIYSVRPID